MKKLIATDFDGTLNINGEVSAYDREQIKRFREAGNYFGVVTGRGETFFSGLKERGIDFDYLIVYNGSLIFDKDGNKIFEAFITAEMFSKLRAFFEKCECATYYATNCEDDNYYHYYATCENQSLALETAAEINRLYGDEITAFVNGPHINIGKKGTGKTQGVLEIMKYYGLQKEDVFAVGDDYNDLDMIVSLNGWAVSTAREDVLKKAPNICNSVGDIVEKLLK